MLKNIKYSFLLLIISLTTVYGTIIYDTVSYTLNSVGSSNLNNTPTTPLGKWFKSEGNTEPSPISLIPGTETVVSTNGDLGVIVIDIAPVGAPITNVVPIFTVHRSLGIDYSQYNLPNVYTNFFFNINAPSNCISVYSIISGNINGISGGADYTVIGDPTDPFNPSPITRDTGIFSPFPEKLNVNPDPQISFPIWAMPNITLTISTSSTPNNFTYSESLTTDGIGYGNSTQSVASAVFRALICTNNGFVGGTNYSTNIYGGFYKVWPTGKTAFSFPFYRGNNQAISNLLFNFPTNIAVISSASGNNSFSTNWHTASGWTEPSAEILSGIGYFLLNTNASFTNFMYGALKVGNINRSWSSVNGTYIFVSPTIPKSGFINDLGFNNDDSDSVAVALWNGTSWESSTWTEEDGWTSLPSFTVDVVKGPYIQMGQPLRLERHGSDSPSWNESLLP